MNELKSILTKEYGKLPVWAWGLVALGGIGIGLYFYRRANSGSSKTSTTTVGQATNSADTSLLNGVGSTGMGDYQTSGDTNANTPGQTVINVGVPTNPSNWLTTLYLTNNGPVPMYDQPGTPGDKTLGNQIATIPGGSTVQATGPEQVGAWLSNNTSELWYPVTYQSQNGYISAYYVANASTQVTGQPQIFPPNSTKYTVTSDDMKQKTPLHNIAMRYHISYDALYNANKDVLGPDKNKAKAKVGMVLTLPAGAN